MVCSTSEFLIKIEFHGRAPALSEATRWSNKTAGWSGDAESLEDFESSLICTSRTPNFDTLRLIILSPLRKRKFFSNYYFFEQRLILKLTPKIESPPMVVKGKMTLEGNSASHRSRQTFGDYTVLNKFRFQFKKKLLC